MRERDENAYIRFFALWFAAGMTLGVLLLLAASHTGMKREIASASFRRRRFLEKISAKAWLFLSSKGRLAPAFAGLLFGLTAIGAYFATAAVWAYGFLCGVFLSAAYLQNGMAGLFIFFSWLFFPQIFLYLAALFLMAAACSRMAETNHLAGGIQKKEYFCFGVRYFFALILLLWGILLESYVNPWFLAKIL